MAVGAVRWDDARMDNVREGRGGRIPLWLKIICTAFVAVLVPFYLKTYGPLNFLSFCDAALFLTVLGLWLESRLVLSMQAVGIVLPQLAWIVDFVLRAVFGHPVMGLTDYMFDPGIGLFVRILSSFHGWLPLVLIFSLWRLGYDRRAFVLQAIFGVALLLASFLFTPRPPPRYVGQVVNINWVFGLGDKSVQTWMAPGLYLVVEMIVFVVCMFLPAHLVFSRLFAGRVGRGWMRLRSQAVMRGRGNSHVR